MLLIDAHVHIYDCFHLEKFFNSTYSNFKSAAERLGTGDNFTGILLLAETSKDNWFNHLAKYAEGKKLPDNRNTGSWIFHRTEENCSIYAKSRNSKRLFIIAGRQIITSEGLEVLALFMNESLKDGPPIELLIKEIKAHCGLPVIPWGFGKWMGRRGKVLSKLLNNSENTDFFLGDNSGRAAFMPRPSFFRISDKKGIRILPGSDPLPLVTEYCRAGSFGFSVNASLSDNKPTKLIRNIILNSSANFQSYGQLEGFLSFLSKQFILRLKS